MPVSSSIHWKPLRDSHYIVASLEPGGGGRRELFIKQPTLSQTQALAQRALGQHAIGLLLGNRYECPNTGTGYLLIESVVSANAAPDEDSFGPMISSLLDQFQGRDGLECVGWFCGVPAVGSRPSATAAAIHTVVFPEPWQVLLTVSDRGDAGAFFLHDKRATRWFLSPFREEVEPSRNRTAAIPTCIAWQTYMTTDATIAPPTPVAARLAAAPPVATRWPAPQPPATLRPAAPAPKPAPAPPPASKSAPPPTPAPMLRAAKPAPPAAGPLASRAPTAPVPTASFLRPKPTAPIPTTATPATVPPATVPPAAVPPAAVPPAAVPPAAVPPRVPLAAPPVAATPAPATPAPAVPAAVTRAASVPPASVPAAPISTVPVSTAAIPAAPKPTEPVATAPRPVASDPTPPIARTAAIPRRPPTIVHNPAPSLGKAMDATTSAVASALRQLTGAVGSVGIAIAGRTPAIRASVVSLGKSTAAGASAAVGASLALVAHTRDASVRLVQQRAARRDAARAQRAAVRAERVRAAEAQAAEQARIAAIRAEEARVAKEARAAEQARVAEEARVAKEARAAEQARVVEEARVAKEARAAEQARLAAIRAEEARAVKEARAAATRAVEERAAQESRAAAARAARIRAQASPPRAPETRATTVIPHPNDSNGQPLGPVVRAVPNRLADLSHPPTTSAAPLLDPEDTAASDPPFRYLALAAREGFVVVANSDTGSADHLDHWVLDDPEAGILLTVITSDVAVRESTLHYNLRTDDAALLDRTPPEHRDLDSRTIYVREPAVENLRARCRRLRASGALVREWKVSPPIDLPHPSRTASAAPGRSPDANNGTGGGDNGKTLGKPISH